MDRTDVALSLLLLTNSRSSIRELADKLGLSVPAVHGRIQSLRDQDILKAFTTKLSLGALRASATLIFGRSQAGDLPAVAERRGGDEHTYWVALAGGGSIYVGGYLREIGELEGYANRVTEVGEISDPVVGLMAGLPGPAGKSPLEDLDRLDYRILAALQRDSRRPIAEVAEQVGVSAKTAARRLEGMVRDGIVEFSTQWYPDASNDIISAFHLDLNPGTESGKAMATLYNEHAPNVLFAWSFGNLPHRLVSFFWTSTMKELRDLQVRLQGSKAFRGVMTNVLYTGWIFDTWRDALLAERARSAARRS